MDKLRLAYSLMLMGLIGPMLSCSSVEQIDHDDPVEPLPKVIDQDRVDRIRHANKVWYPVEKQVIELANE